jgi:hypothetical protein
MDRVVAEDADDARASIVNAALFDSVCHFARQSRWRGCDFAVYRA